jgi:hypothetical protein
MKRIATALFVTVLLAGSLLAVPLSATAEVSVGVSVAIGPPPLPYYPQPFSPGINFIWAPGYWAYDPDGYYWVPGTWVLAPAIGLLWTPGYWGWRDGGYWWNGGYWGHHVGFYGGINYGYGYGGHGYNGGEWRGRSFYYNRANSNVDPDRIKHVYGEPGSHEVQADRVSFNGGAGGIANHATPEEAAYANEHHSPATSRQTKHAQKAMKTAGQRFSTTHARPDVAATERPGNLNGSGAVRRSAAGDAYEYHPAARAGGRGQGGQQRAAGAPHPPRGGGGRPPR